MNPPRRCTASSSFVLAVIPVTLLLLVLVAAPAATAGQKVLVQKLVPTAAGTPTTVPLPILTIQGLGATVVEDYDDMAVVDLGTTTAAALARATGMMVSPLPDHDKVFLRDFILDAHGNLPTGVIAPAFPADRANLYLAILRSIPRAEWVDALRTTGAQVVSYIPDNAYLVYGPLGDLRKLQASNDFLVNVLPFVPEFKLSDRSRLFSSDGYSKVAIQVLNVPSNDAVMAEIQAAALPGSFAHLPTGDVTLVFGQLPNDTIQGLAYSPEVIAIEPAPQGAPSGERDSLIVPGQLASASEINPDTGQPRTVYKPNQSVDYYAWLTQKGLASASDIYLGVLDTGLDTGSVDQANGHPTDDIHIDFLGTNGHTRVQYLSDPAVSGDQTCIGVDKPCHDCDGHGTLVAAIMAGSGGTTTGTPFSETATISNPCAGCYWTCPTPAFCTSGLFWADAGVAPAAQLAVAKIYNQMPGDPGLVQIAARTGLANFAALGVWATNLSTNSGTTAYDSFSQVLDQRVRDASGIGFHLPMTIVVSTGNEGGFVESPGNAKNVISVGASEGYNPFLDQTTCTSFYDANNAYDVAWFSSSTTTDQRIKPDLVAPGTRTMGALTRFAPLTCWGQVSQYDKYCGRNPNGILPGMGGTNPITWSIGTSFSAPAVTGAAGLAAYWYRAGHFILPSPALIKAMLINWAVDIYDGQRSGGAVGHIPSPYQGWGKADLGRAFPNLTNVYTFDQQYVFTQSGQTPWSKNLRVRDTGKPVRVTLTWTDKEGTTISGKVVLNDLVLTVTTPVGRFSGDWFNLTTGESILYTRVPFPIDLTNNVQHVVFTPSTYGISTITVNVVPNTIAAKAIPNGPGTVNQDFALFVDNVCEIGASGC